jgi:hypothetical protein
MLYSLRTKPKMSFREIIQNSAQVVLRLHTLMGFVPNKGLRLYYNWGSVLEIHIHLGISLNMKL